MFVSREGAPGRISAWAAILVAALLLAAAPVRAQDDKSAGPHRSIGFVAGDEATAEDVGLRIYPGARPHKDKDDDSPAARLGAWAGSSGFKLAVLKMESGDPPAKIAAFYRKELTRYGPVLDCTDPPAQNKPAVKDSHQLTCGDDKPEKGGWLFKSGTKEEQRAVGVQPNGSGTLFQLVYVYARGKE
jgi:hypothetical protein